MPSLSWCAKPFGAEHEYACANLVDESSFATVPRLAPDTDTATTRNLGTTSPEAKRLRPRGRDGSATSCDDAGTAMEGHPTTVML